MNCNAEFIALMHEYFDGYLTKKEEEVLRTHLEKCKQCQEHFRELSETVLLLKTAEQISVPPPQSIVQGVMEHLPSEKMHVRYLRWMKRHPIFLSVAFLLLILFSSTLTTWSKENELIVSKQDNLVIEGERVIVPKGITIKGDLFVKNGDLQIDGQVKGNVTLINGQLVTTEAGDLMMYAGEVNGELVQINQLFGWLWYTLKQLVEKIFTFGGMW